MFYSDSAPCEDCDKFELKEQQIAKERRQKDASLCKDCGLSEMKEDQAAREARPIRPRGIAIEGDNSIVFATRITHTLEGGVNLL